MEWCWSDAGAVSVAQLEWCSWWSGVDTGVLLVVKWCYWCKRLNSFAEAELQLLLEWHRSGIVVALEW